MNPDDVQILFAHLQVSLVAGSRTVAPEALAGAATALAEVGAALGLPMTFAVVPERGDLVPGLAAHATEATTFPRHAGSPFVDPATKAALAGSGRKVLVVAGFATEVAALNACLDAMAEGYAVHLPVYAVGGLSERTEAAALRQVERAGGAITCVRSLASRLAPDFAVPPGSNVFAIVQARLPP
ncbi:isochorismatase family protein [Methylorubrum extorquens]|jgi:hypothetical protein|uniref:isochorismatase family protein n=1 Tax=Methylorubrum extorquens TaxID=408 RepID=UPI001EE51822|nr:isochorismatase family protein [Methylorubrum extorquens]MCG5248112.1 isochorismatase family protein [Methylorubrum extorquens]